MHVLFLTPAFPPFYGGGERYGGALARELVRQGCSVTAVTTSAQTEQDFWQGTAVSSVVVEKIDGIQVIRCPIRPFPGHRRGLFAWRKGMALLSMLPGNQTATLLKMARRIPPIAQLETTLATLPDNLDIIHSFNIAWEYPTVNGWQLAQKRSLPFIVTPFLHLGEPGQKQVSPVSFMNHHQYLLENANYILTLTSAAREGLAEKGIAADKVGVIGGGLDPLPEAVDSEHVLRRLGVQRPFTLFIGRTSIDKGAFHAAQAILQLRRQHVPVSLVLIGTITPQFARFYRRLSTKEKEWIRPSGNVSESDKHALLSASRLLLLPSRVDSFGIVLLEAWAHGKPVIGARSGGIPGVIDNGKNGLLVKFGAINDLAAAIERLWQDDGLRDKMGQHGRQKVAAYYTWEQTSQRVLTYYEQVLRNGRF